MLEPKRVDRVVDLASVALISVAAVLTALCGYQSGRWAGQQARLYNLAEADRIRSAEAADRANVLMAIDVGLFLHYVDAVAADDAREATFILQRFRPEAKPAVQAWLATKPLHNPHAPSSPFAMPQYALATQAEAHSDDTVASANFNAAVEATRHSDDFLLLTVIFAGVSFLGGISTKLVYPRHAVAVTVALVGLIYGLIRLAQLPFS